MYLPEQLATILEGYAFNQATIGMSTARTFRLENAGRRTMYLKIDRKNPARQLGLATEKAAMDWIEGKLPVPQVIYYGEDKETQYLLVSALPGVNGIDAMRQTDYGRLACLLAQGLKMLHAVPIAGCPLDWRLEKSIGVAMFNVEHGLVDEADFDRERRGRPAADLVEELLRLKPPGEDLVFTHGDYCVPNVIIDAGKVSGFIDLSRAGVADRYQDLALGTRSIRYNLGPGFDRIFLEEYGIVEPDMKKIEFYKLLDEFY